MSGRVGTAAVIAVIAVIAVTAVIANDGQLLGIEYLFNLSKRNARYATYSRLGNDSVATFQVPGGPTGLAGGKDSSGYEFGVRHSF